MKHYYLCNGDGVTEITDGETAFEWFRARWRTELVWIDVRDGGTLYTWLDSAETATREFMADLSARGSNQP